MSLLARIAALSTLSFAVGMGLALGGASTTDAQQVNGGQSRTHSPGVRSALDQSPSSRTTGDRPPKWRSVGGRPTVVPFEARSHCAPNMTQQTCSTARSCARRTTCSAVRRGSPNKSAKPQVWSAEARGSAARCGSRQTCEEGRDFFRRLWAPVC